MLLQIDEWSLHGIYLDEHTGEWLVPLRRDGNAYVFRFDPINYELRRPDSSTPIEIADHVFDWVEQWLVDHAVRINEARFGTAFEDESPPAEAAQ